MAENPSPDVPLLECKDLSISYFTRAGEIPAVVDFNLTVHAGEAVGLVGESGCGKTTVAMAIMRYLGGSGRIVGGRIAYRGRNLAGLSARELRRFRGNEIAMVYQEPMASLNPSMIVGAQLMEVPLHHDAVSRRAARDKAREVLDAVDLPDSSRIMAAYPHQLSGGQQQRVVIAMALLSDPRLLLLDEPTTALDVTVEAGIVELIAGLGERFGTGMLYISHNLGLIRETCDRIVVMYSGEAVETGTIDRVFAAPRHPYTRGLFDCIALPTTDKHARPLVPIRGRLPLPDERPQGCGFGPRCDYFEA
ncbi:MAG: ABC transporter ATP-binding protein, partial [Rhodospirillaceae bacterium]|nr:ABC transporter ATP-binding protein [Rhodospirillaceae bacterium]